MVAKDAAGREPNTLKEQARMAFNFQAKGRSEEQLTIARRFLTERVTKLRAAKP